MRILFLTIGRKTTPSTRFRVKQYIPYLEQAGLRCEIQHIPHAFYQRVKLLTGLKDYNTVIIQKKLFSALELSLLSRANPNIIYDFDDLVTAEHPMHKISSKVQKKLEKNAKRFENTCKTARGIIAGNEFLAENALEFNKNVVVIPTPITLLPKKIVELPTDLNDNPKNISEITGNIPESGMQRLTVGWIGTKSNLFYLDHFGVAWRELHEKYPNITLKVVCNAPYDSNLVSINNCEWSAEREEADLLSFDIGIMPLTDDDWSKGKCGFKLLQYMSAGLPTVSSPVGANLDIVVHGVNGFLAKDEGEWVRYLKMLIDDPELRMKMGETAREDVKRKYSVQVLKDDFINAIKKFTPESLDEFKDASLGSY